jgi:hypothetical protein
VGRNEFDLDDEEKRGEDGRRWRLLGTLPRCAMRGSERARGAQTESEAKGVVGRKESVASLVPSPSLDFHYRLLLA